MLVDAGRFAAGRFATGRFSGGAAAAAEPVTFGPNAGTNDTSSYRKKGCLWDISGGDALVTSVQFSTSQAQMMELIIAEINGSNQIVSFLSDVNDLRFTAVSGVNTVDLTGLAGGGALFEDGKAYSMFINRGFQGSNIFMHRLTESDPEWIDPTGLITLRQGTRIRSSTSGTSAGSSYTNSSTSPYAFRLTYTPQ